MASKETLQAKRVARLLIINPENPNFPIPQQGEFTFVSGIISPIKMEFDNLPIGSPTEKLFQDLLYQKTINSGLDFNCVGGITKGGVRFSQILAERFNLPHLKIDTKKECLEIDHIPQGFKLRNCILLDDVVTKGHSLGIAQKMLDDMLEVQTKGLFVVFSYGFIQENIYPLADFYHLLMVRDFKKLNFDKLSLKDWHNNVQRQGR